MDIYEGEEEKLVRVLRYLDAEDSIFQDSPRRYAPQWGSLRATIKIDGAFRMYADRLSEDARSCESDDNFRIRIRQVYEDLLKHCDMEEDISNYQGLDVMRFVDKSLIMQETLRGFVKAWDVLPYTAKEAIIDTVLRISRSSMAANMTTVALQQASRIAVVGLAAVHLSYKVYCHMKRWWDGEIDGKWCAKHAVDDTAAIAAGAAGAFGGATIGSALGPIGAVAGGIIGGLVTGLGTNYLIDRITEWIFGLPKSEALSNAYRYLHVPANASNSEVNNSYHRLCLLHHPDKGGNKEEFFILQLHMSTIRQARGEF